jgi:sugar O-acyltransferase (sialic acid O-acetyltransferase NeuD family)
MAILSHFYLTHDSPYEVVAFTVDREYVKEETLCRLPVVPFEEVASLYPPDEYKMLVAILFGRVNKTRADKYSQAKAKGYELISYVSSKAITWPGLVMGDNCIILEHSAVGPFVEIGNDVIISGSSVGHHSVIKDHCFLASNAVVLGCVTIEPYCFLGANSTVRDSIVIARECIIGPGVSITKNPPERSVYIAKPSELLPKPSNELGAWLTWPVR